MTIVLLAAAALAATAVDRVTARRGRTTSVFGARFAMEVDAFLILVLSAFVATSLGVWVLAIGLMRYVYVAARRVLPRLRAVGWLSRHRASETAPAPDREPDEHKVRRSGRWMVTGLAGLLVLVALVGPNRLSQLSPGAFARIPVEGLMGAALVLVLRGRARRVAAVLIGAGLGLLTILKLIDMGFYEAFDRPFHPVFDWSFFGPAIDFVETSFGSAGAIIAVVGAVILALAVLVGMTLAVLRLTRVAVGHRSAATHTLATLGVVWLVCALSGVQLTPQEPVAARSAADHVYDDVRAVREGMTDGQTFAAEAADDAYRYTPGNKLLTALHGKDVLFVFVESYGRVAIEKSDSAPTIDPILDAGTEELKAAGFDSRSAFLTSPTYGGGSWLAHATFQTGLWVDNQQRYGNLNALDRTTFSTAFKRAGWRTVGDVPRNTMAWPEGDFYHFDKVYDARNLGYKGPKFAYATVPDQYTLQHFDQTERDAHGPVMAEIDLITSHTPYTPLPKFLDWDDIGDGTIYKPMPKLGPQPSEVWPDPTKVHAAYTKAIAYSLKSVISYVQTYGDDNLVLVFLGDHQPQPIIASQEGTRDVPITIVARDPAVMARVSGWGWQDGLNPDPKAPVWPMDTFRDKFLTTYGPQTPPNKSAAPR
jgi:hypothetical protein